MSLHSSPPRFCCGKSDQKVKIAFKLSGREGGKKEKPENGTLKNFENFCVLK
jgi:hypothetical protein